MPVERRLREGFHRNADALEPDVEEFLSTVLHRARRRRLVRRRVAASIAVAAVLAIAVLAPRVVDAMRSARLKLPGISPSETATPGPQGLTGTFQGRLWPGLDPVRVDRMVGQWSIMMNPDGTMIVQAPSAFVGVLAGYRFQPQGSGFRTNLFAHDVCKRFQWGRYTWSSSGGALTFKLVRDPCDARLALLTSEATYQPSPLEGKWRMRYSCEQEVRTFQRNILLDSSQSVRSDGRSGVVLSDVYSRDFAWGPSAQTANNLTPKALCRGAPDREHVMKIRGDYITEDSRTIELQGTITFLNDHTITVSDAWGNIDTIDTFEFRLHGDRLILTQTGVHDAWQGTWLEEAPWTRVS
jgi:hypothetical protein